MGEEERSNDVIQSFLVAGLLKDNFSEEELKSEVVNSFLARVDKAEQGGFLWPDGTKVSHVIDRVLFLAVNGECYDSRIRRSLTQVCEKHLEVPHFVVRRAEQNLANLLRNGEDEDGERIQSGIEGLKIDKTKKNWFWKAALYAGIGGTAMALTGGLAAPLVGTGLGHLGLTGLMTSLTAFAGVSGPALSAGFFGTVGATTAATHAARKSRAPEEEDDDFELLIMKEPQSGMRVVIGVSDWLSAENQDDASPWRSVLRLVAPEDDLLAVKWESTLREKYASQLKTFAEDCSETQVLDTWASLIGKVRECAVNLANTLLSRADLVGHRPVTLIGLGLGSEMIFSCLEEMIGLGDSDSHFGIVDSVFLIGSPLSFDLERWQKVRKIISSRLVNVYSENDDLLHHVVQKLGHVTTASDIMPLPSVSSSSQPPSVMACGCAFHPVGMTPAETLSDQDGADEIHDPKQPIEEISSPNIQEHPKEEHGDLNEDLKIDAHDSQLDDAEDPTVAEKEIPVPYSILVENVDASQVILKHMDYGEKELVQILRHVGLMSDHPCSSTVLPVPHS